MKNSLHFLLGFLFLIGTTTYAQTPQFYTGNTNSPSNSFPYAVAAGKAVQSLILPGELKGAYPGLITKFYQQGTASTSFTLTTCTIKMAQSTITTLPASIYTPLTTVYSAASVAVTSTAAGWIVFTLQTPFSYDPTKSLIIEVSQCASSATTYTVTNVSQSGMRRTYINAASCVFTYSGQDANLANIGVDVMTPYYNDAGIASVTKPSGSNIVGVDSVQYMITNYGKSPLTSAPIGWSVDGVTQTSPPNWTGSLNQFALSGPFTAGYYNFPVGVHKIKVWTKGANGISPDSSKLNDTATTSIVTCSNLLSGNYTIGPAPSNFLTFNDALSILNNCGINGPVKFTVKKGTYNERVVITQVNGASATNTITFDGINSDSVKIIYAGASPTAATLAFNGADYITFKNMTIQNTGTAYGVGAWFGGAADYNTIDSCKIIVDTVGTASYVQPIVASGSEISYSTGGNTANYTTISNCLLKGGYMGAVFYGSSYTVKCSGNSVINCTFYKQYSYGIYSYYQASPTYRNNYMSGFRSTSPYGIMNYYSGSSPNLSYNTLLGVYYGIYNYGYSGGPLCDNPQIIGNIIRSSYYGLYCYYSTSSNIERNDIVSGYMGLYVAYETNPLDSSTIINNLVRMGGNASYAYNNALYLVNSTKVVVYHNTFQTDSTYSTTTSYGTGYVRNCTGSVKIKNNIFRSMGNMPCFNSDGAGFAADDLDYNDYYTTTAGNTVAYWLTTSYTSFTVWKSSITTYNKNSISIDPQLVSKYNFHLKPTAPFLRGTIVNIPKDYDNDNRCMSSPTMGADEYYHPYSTLKADFYIDSFVCTSSPYTFLNKAGVNDPKSHYWYLGNKFMTSAFNFSYTFKTSGIDTVTLISQNCSTRDTMTKIFSVQPTNSAPVSTFISSKNLVEVYEEVSLIDLSSSCPQRWKWTISPDSIDDPLLGYRTPTYAFTSGKDTSQFPKITFLYSNKYTICLTTINSFDTGTTYCVNNYIEVKPSSMLCIYPFDTKETYGTLYDEGGYLGQYLPNKTCGFSIHPCATSVRLVFSSFAIDGTLTSGDFLRIFDGPDNKSKPLWNSTAYPLGINNSTTSSIPTLADTFVGTSGMLYIELSADASTQANGFVANWTSIHEKYTAPDASFDVADTVCNGVPTFFHNTSTGTQNDSYWDFDNDSYTDDNTKDGLYTYQWDGPYTVKLTVSGCGGTDTFSKNIIVQTALSSPQFEIMADNYKPNIFTELVTINENTLMNCVDSTIWDITPKSFTLVSGKLQNSYSLGLKFNDTVCYDFRVIGIYHGMSDTVNYPCFIKPLMFCKPVASNISADIGISRVALNTINNYSDAGVSEYTDYTNSIITDLEKGARYDITLERKTNFNPISRKVWIDYNMDGYFNDKTELAAYDSSSKSLSWTGMISLPKNIGFITTRMRVGTSLAGSPNTACGPNYFGEYEDYKVHFIPDITKPVISLIGATMLHVAECSPAFVDPGFIANDNVDTHMSDSVVISGTVNTKVFGTYPIKYNLKDAAGNIADELIRTVIVDKETEPPVFNLLGPLTESIQVFHAWKDAGYNVYDTCSGLDTVKIINYIDTSKLGSYTVNYEAFDKSGNSVTAFRTIHVIDTIAPVLKSISKDTIQLRVYQLLPNPLYTITDNYYTDIALTIKGTYYENFPNGEATNLGYYTFKYIATDGSGNSDSISFIIRVVDDVKPVLQLNGFAFYGLCRFDTLTDPGYTVKDNFDKKPVVVKSGSYVTDYLVNRKVGPYDLIYTATDNSGNSSVESRSISVTDQGDCFSSVSPAGITNEVKLYPNPGNGKFNIEFNISAKELTAITIYDALGNIVSHVEEQITPGQIKTFDNQDMKPGMYFIQLKQGEKITTLKYNLMQ
jgi:parallel beta-helix repeat protein